MRIYFTFFWLCVLIPDEDQTWFKMPLINTFIVAVITEDVLNLCSDPMTPVEIKMQSKGLTFCPASGKIDEFQLYQDLDIARTLRLKEIFMTEAHTSKPIFR